MFDLNTLMVEKHELMSKKFDFVIVIIIIIFIFTHVFSFCVIFFIACSLVSPPRCHIISATIVGGHSEVSPPDSMNSFSSPPQGSFHCAFNKVIPRPLNTPPPDSKCIKSSCLLQQQPPLFWSSSTWWCRQSPLASDPTAEFNNGDQQSH